MGKEEILSYLKNAKIEDDKLEKICYFFAKDFTASQTAKELNISRQTINNYYKIIRILLLQKQDELILFLKNNNFCNDSFNIKYIKSNKEVFYFIECNEKVFILDTKHDFMQELDIFVKQELKDSLQANKKANSAKILYSKSSNKYLVSNFFRSTNLMEEFVQTRLRKFRGLTKENLEAQIKESQFRFNYTQEYLYNTLLKLLNLNCKTSAF